MISNSDDEPCKKTPMGRAYIPSMTDNIKYTDLKFSYIRRTLLTIKKLIYSIKPPCPKCPYTLGHVYFVHNPCFACALDNYQIYHILAKGMLKCPQGNDPRKGPKQG